MIGHLIYALCAATCMVCAVLLLRGHRRSGARLLLWSGWCFVGLALNNVVLVIDMVALPEADLRLVRDAIGLLSVSTLIIGLVWDSHD